jgi:hypothetical protein
MGMKSLHADFELLCLCAVTGDLDRAEEAGLCEHLRHCISCRTYLSEMTRLEAGFALTQELKNARRLPNGMRARFIARAAQEGISLHAPVPGSSSASLRFATALLLILLFAAAMLKAGPFFRSTQSRQTVLALSPNLNEEPRQVVKATPLHIPPQNLHRARVSSAVTGEKAVPLEHRRFIFTPALLPAGTHAFGLLKEQRPIPMFAFRADSQTLLHFSPPLLADGEEPVASRPAGPNFRLLKVDFTVDGYRRMQIEGVTAQ